MKNPKISIITPSFNSASFIEDCLLSVINQNYPNFEHIIVDGGSSDGTIEILKKYPHLKWISEPDKGQSDAINKGFRLATGELAGWLNSDDYYLPDCFKDVASFSNINKNSQVFYGERIRVNTEKELIKHQKDHKFDFQVLLYDYCYISSTATFFRNEIFKNYKVDTNYKILMDLEYYARLHTSGAKFCFIPKPLAGFRIHESNISRNNDDRRIFERNTIQNEYGFLPSNWRIFNKYFYKSVRWFFKSKRIYLRYQNKF